MRKTCGICGRRLRNRASMIAGVGPICAGRIHLTKPEKLQYDLFEKENPDETNPDHNRRTSAERQSQ